ncbi:hypothetical protein DID78_05930 [Candidatus Marinamargulisbacteria bacterium SCGC AG-343-D04]|nr:hypothetical protein DID78_05930 [Candidatus Marinamargulisbacteria bacterium SCGC AG-343-D04]
MTTLLKFIKQTSQELFKYLTLLSILLVTIWIINLHSQGKLSLGKSTMESQYEQEITTKTTQFLQTLLNSQQFKVFTTVTFKEKLEKVQKTVKIPKEFKETQSTESTIESKSTSISKTIERKSEKNPVTLPGMTEMLTDTRFYDIKESSKPEKKQSKRNSSKTDSNKIYFDEENIEIKYKDNRIDTLKVLILFDYSIFEENDIMRTEIQHYLENILSINYDRGDQLLLEKNHISTQFNIVETSKLFLEKHITTPLKNVYKKVRPYWYVPLLALAFFLLIKLIMWLISIRNTYKQKKEKDKQALEDTDTQDDSQEKQHAIEPTYKHPKEVISAIQKAPDTTIEIIENWLREDNDK